VRKYAVAAKPPKVSPISIEGEKDIDHSNPKTLIFHVEGGYPESATLYLRALQFSTLYYTELGQHTHTATASVANETRDFAHTHNVTGGKTTTTGKHKHAIWIDDGKDAAGADVDTGDDWNDKIISESGDHEHNLQDITMSSALGPWTHNHSATVTVAGAGVTDKTARSGAGQVTLKYVNDLQIWFDGDNITADVLQQLRGRDPAKWPLGSTLGNGTAAHVLVNDGTKEIHLNQIVPDIGPGEHKLEFKVATGGGQIHYNLYVG
jgi:hypothetical protein